MTNPNQSNSRNLPAVQQPRTTALTRSAADVAANIAASAEVVQAIKQIDPELAARVLAIVASQNDKKPLSVPRAIQAAAWEQKTGHNIGSHAYVDDRLGVMEGVRGLRDDVSQQAGAFETHFRQLTAEEHDTIMPPLGPHDMAIACEVLVYDHYHRALGVMEREKRLFGEIKTPWRSPTGIGIIRETERYESKQWNDGANRFETLPREQYLKRPLDLGPNFSWDKKLRIRAEREALKRVPGVKITAAELFDAAEEAGLGAEIEQLGITAEQRARLSREQAEVIIERAERDAGREELAGADLQDRFRANVAAMRRPDGFVGFGDEEEPGPTPAGHAPAVEVLGPEPEPAPPHWSQRDNGAARLFAYAQRVGGFDEAQALAALGADDLRDFAGTAADAKAMIDAAVDAAMAELHRQ